MVPSMGRNPLVHSVTRESLPEPLKLLKNIWIGVESSQAQTCRTVERGPWMFWSKDPRGHTRTWELLFSDLWKHSGSEPWISTGTFPKALSGFLSRVFNC